MSNVLLKAARRYLDARLAFDRVPKNYGEQGYSLDRGHQELVERLDMDLGEAIRDLRDIVVAEEASENAQPDSLPNEWPEFPKWDGCMHKHVYNRQMHDHLEKLCETVKRRVEAFEQLNDAVTNFDVLAAQDR